MSANTSFQTCKDDEEDGYTGDISNLEAQDNLEDNETLQNVNILSEIDSIADVLSSMGIQSPKQQQV